MFAISTLLLVLVLSLLVTKIASVALMHTGLSADVAKFQARSAFTGAGFTTSESERVVNHPVRRRILAVLMALGNAGIITAVSTLILAFIEPESAQPAWLKVVLLVTGLLLLWAIVSSKWVDRRLSSFVERLLGRYTDIEVKDYANVLGLSGDYAIVEIHIAKGHWLAGQKIASARPRDEGIVILGIQHRDGKFSGAPSPETAISVEDTLVVYGRREALKRMGSRTTGYEGDAAHTHAVIEQKEQAAKEEKARASLQ